MCLTYNCTQPWLALTNFRYCANAHGVRVASPNSAFGVNTGAYILRQLLDAVGDDQVTAWLRTHFWMPVLNGSSFEDAVRWQSTFPSTGHALGDGNGGDQCVEVTPGLGYALVSCSEPYINLHEAVHVVSHGLAHRWPAEFGHDTYDSTVGRAAQEAVRTGVYRAAANVNEPMTVIPEFVQRVVEDHLNVTARHRSSDYTRYFTHGAAPLPVQAGIDAIRRRFRLTGVGLLDGKPFGVANYTSCVDYAGQPSAEQPGVSGSTLCHDSQMPVETLIIIIGLLLLVCSCAMRARRKAATHAQ